MHSNIYEKLKHVAAQEDVTYYSDIAPLASLDMSNPDDRNTIADILGEISTHEHAQGHPLLSAVVIHKDNNIPGNGFFTLAEQLGLYHGGNNFMFFVKELQRVHDFWKEQ